LSRLNSFIRRLEAQQACLNLAASLVRDLAGDVLELGLGNGRTYDHLRELFPDRPIYVCDRRIAAHPECVPPADRLILGDMRETLPAIRGRLEARIALAHLDAGAGEHAANAALARAVAPFLAPLLVAGGVLVSDPAIDEASLAPLPLPPLVRVGRYHLYRKLRD
jgi:S-adenosyl-L-methionine methyltransferase